jgi:hypothetical protein
MENFWVESKWTREELNGMTVKFSLPVRGGTLEGIGEFLASENEAGLLSLRILARSWGRNLTEVVQIRLELAQSYVDAIERTDAPAEVQFHLVCTA